jgi:hypothetical protein
VNTRLDGPPDPARLALEEPDGDDLGHGVVLRLVVTGHRRQRAVPVAFEGIAGLGREDLDPTPVQDLHDVFGERPKEPRVLPVGREPPDLTVELIVEPDQIGHHGLEDDPPDPAVEPLVLLVQSVNDRFSVHRTPVEFGQLCLHLIQAPGQFARQRRPGVEPSRGRSILRLNRNLLGLNRNLLGLNRNLLGLNRNLLGLNRNFLWVGHGTPPSSGRTRTTLCGSTPCRKNSCGLVQVIGDLSPLPEERS